MHMSEELARHAEHGDIIREQILAAYGSQTERLLRNAPIHVPALGGSALAATPQADPQSGRWTSDAIRPNRWPVHIHLSIDLLGLAPPAGRDEGPLWDCSDVQYGLT